MLKRELQDNIIITPTLNLRKLKQREVKKPTQGHTVVKLGTME